MIRTIPHVVQSRSLDPRRMGWLSSRRAETRVNFPANFAYVDLRGRTVADLARALAEENRAYRSLAERDATQSEIDEIDRHHALTSIAPMLDFGMAAGVIALSVMGCIPVTSCRGPTLGTRPHAQPAPMIVFYARRLHLPVLLQTTAAADCQLVNNEAKLELYADDLRKIHDFAAEVLRRYEPGG